jgi:enoyl-CoA hydratase
MGLVNRLCSPGRALESAVALAREIAALPQTCLREDRLSLRSQWELSETDAMDVELAHGLVSLASDALAGASRFASGAGRHGVPDDGAGA